MEEIIRTGKYFEVSLNDENMIYTLKCDGYPEKTYSTKRLSKVLQRFLLEERDMRIIKKMGYS